MGKPSRRGSPIAFYTRQDFNKELCDILIERHGTVFGAARAIVSRCRDREGNEPSAHAVRLWINDGSKGLIRGDSRRVIDPVRERIANQILNVIGEAGIPLDSLDHDNPITTPKLKSGFHEVVTKDKDGRPQLTRARSKSVVVTLNPKFKGPEWPVVQPAKAAVLRFNTPSPKKKPSDYKTIVVLSDLQVGFLRDIEDIARLVPIHDQQAINVAIQIVADLQPDQIGYVGDFLDLAEMSRWLQTEEFWRTTQPAIEEGYKILAKFEIAAGRGRTPTQFVAGNHDRRLREYVQKNARAAFHLRPAMSTPETWPDLSIPRLLRFDELGIQYVGEYPGGEWWITPKLVVRHNPESPRAYSGSVIAGHTHRVSRTTTSSRTQDGPCYSTRYEIGCLCRLDKYSDRRSLMATSVPSDRGFIKDWAHGFAVVTVAKDGAYTVEQVEYAGPGRAIFRGREYTSKEE